MTPALVVIVCFNIDPGAFVYIVSAGKAGLVLIPKNADLVIDDPPPTGSQA